ncbi:MAG: ABC transporter permease [Anaerolineae bacterium]|nr:ABC transporter permease [Anaerolineae bacterium]
MLNRILAIAWNGIYRTYTDRVAVVYMFLAPIAISTIIGLAFGTQDNDINLPDAEIKIVNLDEGYTTPDGRQVNLGQQNYVEVLVENPPESLEELISASLETDLQKAREMVDKGDIRAVLIIPPEFSARVNDPAQQGEVELYYNPRAEVSVTVVIAIVEQLTDSVNMGQVAQTVYVGESGYFIQQADSPDQIGAAANDALSRLYSGEADPGIRLNRVNIKGEKQEFDMLAYFAPSMAIFFMTFAMAAGTQEILQEQRNWTMQRILTTPTPRWVYMFGKLLGTYGTGLIQMLILLFVTPFIAFLLGREGSLWGNNYLGLALVTLSVVAAGTGLGLLISSFSKNMVQAEGISSAVLILLGLLGGTFVPIDVEIMRLISNLSLNKWGIDGFNALANDNASLGEILPNVLVLLGMAAVYFVVALWQFGRRAEI